MHEFKHGELKSSTGDKVRNPKQAIAIALHEAGASNQESPKENRRNLKRTKLNEAKGATAMQEAEGPGARTRSELYEEAKRKNVPGRSTLSKAELERALKA
jgi:hypothetical protein